MMQNVNPWESHRRPAASSAVIAHTTSLAPNEVLVVGNYRYIVRAEISKEEFLKQLESNLSKKGGVAGAGRVSESNRITADDFRAMDHPDFEGKHFYRCEVELFR